MNPWIAALIAILLAPPCFLVLLFVFCWVCSLFVNKNKRYDKESRFYRSVLEFSTAIAMRLVRIKIHAKGLEKIPAGRFVLVSNHVSKFDPIIAWHILKKRRLSFITKPENFKVPIFGAFIWRCCFVGIDRENPRNAIADINRAAAMIKADKNSYGVYPEGKRSFDGTLLPFHSGVFRLAQKADVPLVIAVFSGTGRIHKNYPLHRSDVYFEVLEVIGKEDVHKLGTGDMSNRAHDIINEALKAYN